ncbi:MAG: GtrA family protein [archaeon]
MRSDFLKTNIIHFSKYTLIGGIASLINILLVWLFVDIVKLQSFLGISLAVFLVFLLKFYFYIIIKLIKKQFLKYTFIQIISAILNIVLTWILIELFGMNTIIATTGVVAVLFLLRFILFKITNLISD